ncbi:MAG: efflux RND transporter periplasmic adaptor subunit, partial [Pseudomonadota bacterium]
GNGSPKTIPPRKGHKMSDSPSNPTKSQKAFTGLVGILQLVLVIGVLVAAFALNRILVANGGGGSTDPAPVVSSLVEIIQPSVTSRSIVIEETGTVEPRAELTISPQVGGRIKTVSPALAAGGAFKAGETLFTIDQEDFRLRLRQAEADLRTANSNLALEQAEAASAIREWNLVNPGEAVPPLVGREPQLAQARASVEVANASIEDAKLALRRTRFSFPFDGRVLATTLQPGVVVAPNQPYGTVYQDDSVEVVIFLAADDLASLEPIIGRTATVTNGSGVSADAIVTRVDGVLDARSRQAGIILSFENDVPFIPGSFVSAALQGPVLEDVISLPPGAVSAAGQVWIVENDRLSRRKLEVLSRTDAAVLVTRFATGDGVVTTPPAGAREGQTVRTQSQSQQTAEQAP